MKLSRVLFLLLLIAVLPNSTLAEEKDKKRTPKITISKDTTRITEPLDEDGYPDYAAALNKLLRKDVTPLSNSNVLLWKALGPRPERSLVAPAFFKLLGIDPPPEQDDYFVALRRFALDHLKLEPGEQLKVLEDQQAKAVQRSWTVKEYPHLAHWLKANEKPLAIVVEASRRPDYFHPLVIGKTEKGPTGLIGALPSVQSSRGFAMALTARAMLHAGEGRFEASWQDLLACHRLARLVSRGSTNLELLVGIALDNVASTAGVALLDSSRLTSEQARTCLRDLQRLAPMPSVADKIDLGERFFMLDSILLIQRQGFGYLGDPGFAPGKEPSLQDRAALDSIDWDLILRNNNRWYGRIVLALRIEKRAERERVLETLDKELRALKEKAPGGGALAGLLALLGGTDAIRKQVSQSIGDVLINMTLPAFRRLQQAEDRNEQIQRNLQIAFALAAYRHEQGSYPKQLADLAPKYLKAIPDDLFSGKALIYRSAEKGYLLYSVGVNGKDDGGRGSADDPAGDDLAVRIPLPKLPQK
jgi:hypothetical protein